MATAYLSVYRRASAALRGLRRPPARPSPRIDDYAMLCYTVLVYTIESYTKLYYTILFYATLHDNTPK